MHAAGSLLQTRHSVERERDIVSARETAYRKETFRKKREKEQRKSRTLPFHEPQYTV
jgi:hypothetical protein